jgi:hypothetical protein
MMYGPPNYAGHTSPATFQGRRGQFQHAVYKKRDVFHIFDVITWKGGIAALINSCYQTQMEQWSILLGQNQSSYSYIARDLGPHLNQILPLDQWKQAYLVTTCRRRSINCLAGRKRGLLCMPTVLGFTRARGKEAVHAGAVSQCLLPIYSKV